MIDENTYEISFRGNGFTSLQRTKDFAMLRAAEIGQRLLFTHFVVQGTNSQLHADKYITGTATSIRTQTISKPRIDIAAIYFDEYPEGRYLKVHDVQSVLVSLREKYRLTSQP